MSAEVTIADVVIAYAVLVGANDACDAVDEVVVAAPSWRAATDLMRASGYRRVPRRPARTTIERGAVEVAFATPGTVFRRRIGGAAPWTPYPTARP
ncbi:hypothetical protein AB0G79_10280 [Streptomyces sp. NPDC020807]|uniref:hypothetical protein n=1 Tax=Streptomyces sp. NPDC020807 TaxID=3155119 RepID=UPI0033ECE64D